MQVYVQVTDRAQGDGANGATGVQAGRQRGRESSMRLGSTYGSSSGRSGNSSSSKRRATPDYLGGVATHHISPVAVYLSWSTVLYCTYTARSTSGVAGSPDVDSAIAQAPLDASTWAARHPLTTSYTTDSHHATAIGRRWPFLCQTALAQCRRAVEPRADHLLHEVRRGRRASGNHLWRPEPDGPPRDRLGLQTHTPRQTKPATTPARARAVVPITQTIPSTLPIRPPSPRWPRAR